MRLKAAAVLGYEVVPVIIIHGLTELEEKEIVIKDNVSAGRWDMEALSTWDLAELYEWGVDLQNTEHQPLSQEILNEQEQHMVMKRPTRS